MPFGRSGWPSGGSAHASEPITAYVRACARNFEREIRGRSTYIARDALVLGVVRERELGLDGDIP